jgi:hypothetical protein
MVVIEAQPLDLTEARASSSLPGWPPGAVIDRNPLGTWSSQPNWDHLIQAEWVAVILAAETTVDRVELDPRGEASWSLGFPKDFVLQYSFTAPTPGDDRGPYVTCDPADPRFYDLTNWRPLASYSGYPQPGGEPIGFAIPPTTMGCFRLFGAELSQDDYGLRYLQLDEIALYADSTRLPLPQVRASSSLPDWGADAVTDGNPVSTWSSQPHWEHLAQSEWVAVLLPAEVTVDRIELDPRGEPPQSLGFPKDFVLQYSFDAPTPGDDRGPYVTCDPDDPRFGQLGNWRPLKTFSNYPQPDGAPISFTIPPTTMGCFRLFGAELSQDDYGARYLQLDEIRLFDE